MSELHPPSAYAKTFQRPHYFEGRAACSRDRPSSSRRSRASHTPEGGARESGVWAREKEAGKFGKSIDGDNPQMDRGWPYTRRRSRFRGPWGGRREKSTLVSDNDTVSASAFSISKREFSSKMRWLALAIPAGPADRPPFYRPPGRPSLQVSPPIRPDPLRPALNAPTFYASNIAAPTPTSSFINAGALLSITSALSGVPDTATYYEPITVIGGIASHTQIAAGGRGTTTYPNILPW
ncbi:hypothetical protein C8Q79DRAFT_927808 [Trametes meyenii]|nr:hypothetical protein C8Q79DRAFT_927808 [Trametes meyenii]